MPLALATMVIVSRRTAHRITPGGSHHDPAALRRPSECSAHGSRRASGDRSGGAGGGSARRSTGLCRWASNSPTRPTPTRILIDGFVHGLAHRRRASAGSRWDPCARRRLHCASDQDHALFWETGQPHRPYAADLAAAVIRGLWSLGCAPVTAATWPIAGPYSVDQWQAILRERWKRRHRTRSWMPMCSSTCGRSQQGGHRAGGAHLAAGARSARLLHGLALAAISFPTLVLTSGRLPKGPGPEEDRSGAGRPAGPALRAAGAVTAVGTDERLAAAAAAGCSATS